MAIAECTEIPRKQDLFQKRYIPDEVRKRAIKDYQYSDKTVNQIAQEYGLTIYEKVVE